VRKNSTSILRLRDGDGTLLYMTGTFRTVLAAFMLVGLATCRDVSKGEEHVVTDTEFCGPMPVSCNADSPTCDGRCGEFYYCDCNRDSGRWGETILDCWCFDCNPVTQSGCEAGEKCAQLVESAHPFLARTTCVPDGNMSEGSVCSDGEAGEATGFDDCLGGYDCTDGLCAEICDVGPPDGCRSDSEAFGEGSYCTIYDGLFANQTGVCEPGCHPVNDSVANGAITNARCSEDEGCYLDAIRGVATCSEVDEGGATKTQNDPCLGPASGGCYPSGCTSGFAPLLNNKPVDADQTLCTRYCSPLDTHAGAQTGATGANGNCAESELASVGGTNANGSEHQCRFVQSFYEAATATDASVGMCVPINPEAGGTWSDCRDFQWDTIKLVWNDAIAARTNPQTAFNEFCLENPGDPASSPLNAACIGLTRGCIRLQERATGLPGAAMNF